MIHVKENDEETSPSFGEPNPDEKESNVFQY